MVQKDLSRKIDRFNINPKMLNHLNPDLGKTSTFLFQVTRLRVSPTLVAWTGPKTRHVLRVKLGIYANKFLYFSQEKLELNKENPDLIK